MARSSSEKLSRRERQIMDVLYEVGPSTVADVRRRLPDPPSYSAVRAMLRVLEEKGHLRHTVDGPRYVYRPTVARQHARRNAVRHLIRTFFDGSVKGAVPAMLDMEASKLSDADLDRLNAMIDEARKEGR